MRLVIRTPGLDLSADQTELVDRRIRFAVGRFADRIDRVDVRFVDVNGQRGGEDVHCCIRVRLAGRGLLHAEDLSSAPEVAVSRAAARLGRTLTREMERRKAR